MVLGVKVWVNKSKKVKNAKNDDYITCGGMLVWAKRVEVQRAQAAVLNTLTESDNLIEYKYLKKTKDDIDGAPVS